MRVLVSLLGMLLIVGCTSMNLDDFKGTSPKLLIEEYFQGKTEAWGVFYDRFGNLRRQFTVSIEGTWDSERKTLTLVEDFIYSDGETEQRVWTIKKSADGSYEGRADGVVGVASGRSNGRAFYWTYDFNLLVGDDTWKVRFEDWMILQDDAVMFNRATLSKLGIRLGEVSIFFRKSAPTQTSSVPVTDRAA
jgi:hypothetical protein